MRVEYLFFIGSQLVALSSSGKLGVWHAMTQHWQTQDVVPIASFDTAGSFLLLGCNNGCIYYIGKFKTIFIYAALIKCIYCLDMQKFPLRMKDNDLLVTELYKDPNNDPVTAISVYLTPKTSKLSTNTALIFIENAIKRFDVVYHAMSSSNTFRGLSNYCAHNLSSIGVSVSIYFFINFTIQHSRK